MPRAERAGAPLPLPLRPLPRAAVLRRLLLRLLLRLYLRIPRLRRHRHLLLPQIRLPDARQPPLPRAALSFHPLRPRPPDLAEPVDLRLAARQRRPVRQVEQPEAGAAEDLHVLADYASRLVPLQPAQELRIPERERRLRAEPAEREEVRDDELAGEDRGRRGRPGEESPGRSDQAVVAPAEAEGRFPAASEPAIGHVHGGGALVKSPR